MGIISWIILGLLAGVIAKVLLPGRDPGGFIGTTFIGIAGAFIGGWISARWLDHPISKDFYDGATWPRRSAARWCCSSPTGSSSATHATSGHM